MSRGVQPGWWFATGRAEICEVRRYHQHLLTGGDGSPYRIMLGDNRGQRDHAQRGGPESAKEAGLRAAQRAQQAVDQMVASAPAPPRSGFVVATPWTVRNSPSGSWREWTGYPAAENARDALASLRRVAEACGGLGEERLGEVVEQYCDVQRTDYRPARTLFLPRARISPSALGRFCLRAARREQVQQATVAFAQQYGPLVLDFGAWCDETEYGAFATRHPASASHLTSPLRLLGHERFLWPPSWRRWATGLFRTLGRFVEPPPRVAAPVGFYVWAALMLTALRRHPEWEGSRLFLANRLASLRLVSDITLDPLIAKDVTERQRARFPVRLQGELLDYLAFAAARGPRARQAGEARAAQYVVTCANANCLHVFNTWDGRQSYCDRCQDSRTQAAERARRYRERHPR